MTVLLLPALLYLLLHFYRQRHIFVHAVLFCQALVGLNSIVLAVKQGELVFRRVLAFEEIGHDLMLAGLDTFAEVRQMVLVVYIVLPLKEWAHQVKHRGGVKFAAADEGATFIITTPANAET